LLPAQIKNIDIGQGIRDNFPRDKIDLKIKTDIADFFRVLQKIFVPDAKKPPRPVPVAAVFSMNRRQVSGRAHSPDCHPSQ
jgi:hypothetical protein